MLRFKNLLIAIALLLSVNACNLKENPKDWIEGQWLITDGQGYSIGAMGFFGYDFRPNGDLYNFINPDISDSPPKKYGTWSIKGERLVIKRTGFSEKRFRVIKNEEGFIMKDWGKENRYRVLVRP